MKKILLLVLSGLPAFGASPATCTAIADMTTAAAFNTAANWTCTADGGAGVSFRGSTGTAITAGVPGAAGKKDRIRTNGHIVNTGNLHIQIGDATASEPSQGLIVDASGTFTGGDGGYVQLDGYNTSGGLGGLAQVIRNGQFTVSPGGWLALNANTNGVSEFENRGRFNIGAVSAGAWVQAVAGSPGSFQAWTGGSGVYAQFNGQTLPTVAVGDLVMLDPIPIPATTGNGLIGPPYSAFGDTIPLAAQPVGTMPVTTDSTTCGARANCLIPQGQLLCVTNVSPVRLGFTTSIAYSCSGSVSFPITATGTAPLWLKKVAVVSSISANSPGWAVSQTLSAASIGTSGYDALYSRFAITAPIANAAGTGPGRPGDTSLAITAVDITTAAATHCTILRTRSNRESDMTQCGDWWADENTGQLGFWGSHDAVTISATWKSRSTTINVGNPAVTSPAAGVTGNEMNFTNALILDLYGSSGASVFVAKAYNTSLSNGGFSVNHTTTFGYGLFDLYSLVGSASLPVSMEGNAYYRAASPTNSAVIRNFNGSTWLDLSQSLLHTRDGWIFAISGSLSTNEDNPHLVFAGNVGFGQDSSVLAYSFGTRDTFSDAIVQRNRFESSSFLGGSPNTAIVGLSGTSGHTAIHEWNYCYASYICEQYGGYTTIAHTYLTWNSHHSLVQTWNAGAGTPTYSPGVTLKNIVNIEAASTCAESGYETEVWLDGFTADRFTCLGASVGGITIGDEGGDNQTNGGDIPSVSLISGAQFKNSVIYTDVSNGTTGVAWGFELSPSFPPVSNCHPGDGATVCGNTANYACIRCGANAIYGLKQINYYHTPTANAPPNQPLKTFNRFNSFSGVTNVTGVALQNATYTSVSGGTLTFTRTSASNMTLTWNDTGGAGAATQLNYAGAGVSYTGGAVTDGTYAWASHTFSASTNSGTGKIVITGACGTGNWTANPQGYFLVDTTRTLTLGVMECIDADTFYVVPAPSAAGAQSGDNYVIMRSMVRLNNSGSSNYVDAGIDPRLLPATSQTDSSVSLALTDFCSSGCSANLSLGLPGGVGNGTDYTNDVSNAPIITVASPSLGGDATQAFGCIGNVYTPSGTSWKTSALDGGYIGAVAPCLINVVPTFAFIPDKQ